MPAPWRFRLTAVKVTWIENALAPGMKVMEEMVMSVERVGEVCVEVPKVAVSPALTGATPPDQFVPEFQSAEAGASSQVASTASAEKGRKKKEEVRSKQETRSLLPDNIERGKPKMTAEWRGSVCNSAPNAQRLFCVCRAESKLRITK